MSNAKEVVGMFRTHGKTAIKYWDAELQNAGLGDAYAALAMAEYMQQYDKIVAIEYSRKKDEDGNQSVIRRINYKLSNLLAVRNSGEYKQDALTAINRSIFSTVFGLKDLSADYTAKLKTRISRAYPAALALCTRANELNVKLSEVVTVQEDGKILISDAINYRNEKRVVIDGDIVEPMPVEERLKKAPAVNLVVSDLARRAKEWNLGSNQTGNSTTQKSHDPVINGAEKAEEARMMMKNGFVASTRNVSLRLKAIMTDGKNSPALSEEEIDALAVLMETIHQYENTCAANERMKDKEQAKPAEDKPKATRTRKKTAAA